MNINIHRHIEIDILLMDENIIRYDGRWWDFCVGIMMRVENCIHQEETFVGYLYWRNWHSLDDKMMKIQLFVFPSEFESLLNYNQPPSHLWWQHI